jgi:DNA-binding MarR family transcriptional regulator
MSDTSARGNNPVNPPYQLDEQVGYLLRRAQQRHLSIFSEHIPDFTPTQFAALARLHEAGALSQNELGRQAAMDAATIKGVIDRLRKRGLVSTRRDDRDQRRIYLDLTVEGRKLYLMQVAKAATVTAHTVSRLSEAEHTQLVSLLKKLV